MLTTKNSKKHNETLKSLSDCNLFDFGCKITNHTIYQLSKRQSPLVYYLYTKSAGWWVSKWASFLTLKIWITNLIFEPFAQDDINMLNKIIFWSHLIETNFCFLFYSGMCCTFKERCVFWKCTSTLRANKTQGKHTAWSRTWWRIDTNWGFKNTWGD